MPQRKNLKPTLPDTLRQLRHDITAGNTVPHGVKTVQPGEGMQLIAPQGVEDPDIFWGWETATTYRNRIDAAQEAVAGAADRLKAAEQNIASGTERINENIRILDELAPEITGARQTAEQAAADLNALAGTVADVSAAATAADQKATAAQSSAAAASATASEAASKATTAQSSADQAKTAAGTAEAAARAASGLAASKGETIYQESPPTGSRASEQNLWIRVSDSRPHTWDGSKWVQVTDKAATDAAQSAAAAASKADAAQSAADQAKADAAAASRSAVEAMTRAGQAQASADGKSTISATVNPPSGVGLSVGDLHMQLSSLGSGGQILRQWRWSGTTWVDQKISGDFISNLDVGKLTGVFANISQHLQAGSIGTELLTVGIGSNIVPNGGGQAPGGWSAFGYNSSGPDANNGYPGSFWIKGRANAASSKIPITPGTWAFTVSAKGQHDGGRFYLQVRCYDITGTYMYGPYAVSNQVIPNGTWQNFSGEVVIPAGVATMDLYIYANHPNGTVADDYQWFTGFSLKELVPGSLVVNGSITGQQIEGGSVAAEVVRSMTAEHRKLVVTEDALLAQATVLGALTAEEINSRRLIRGRDAILDGTVDIEQLNVTGEMAGAMARFMDVEARRAIFTEGMTSAQSTLLGTTIAEAINADAVAGRIMTGGKLQTSTAANRGVKVDNAGIRAWNDTGAQTVQINGKTNFITGSFSTAEKEQRVEIKSGGNVASADFFGSGDTIDHLGVWHNAAGANTVSKIISFNQMAQHKNSPGMLMYPFRGEFTFAGRWARNSDTVKMFSLVNYTGLAGGAWVDLSYTYATPFTDLYSEIIPVISVESRSGAECTVNTRTNNRDAISLRVVNKSGNATGTLYVRGIVFNFNTVNYTDYW